ncbi:MAG: flagellar motor protein MotD [Burkholderiales bacterium]|nr:flagellar motor protein MotD [Burkholderiales bacterium]
MRRRAARHAEEHENHERWLVSYADFITLLFAFFVVMYAISTLNEGKYRVLSDALVAAFRHDRIAAVSIAGPAPIQLGKPPPAAPRPQDTARRKREQKLVGLAGRLSEALQPLVRSGQVRLTQGSRGLAVEINASVLFASGQAMLQPGSIAPLVSVAEVLASVDNALEVEGHTDNAPIASSLFPSNWELASARASAVVRLFIANGVAPERLTATGHADNRPVESNETLEGRARNRRVTLVVLSDTPESAASRPAGGPG